MQLITPTTTQARIDPSPSCDDCRLPATLRAEVADLKRGRPVRVYQCENCAKVIWNHD